MKTVSLELAKQLKEAGYPQEGSFWWMQLVNLPDWDTADPNYLEYYGEEKPTENPNEYKGCRIIASVPTADEILERLPAEIEITKRNQKKGEMKAIRVSTGWYIYYVNESINRTSKEFLGETLADAAAKMWLYLKEHNLLEVGVAR